MTDEHGQSGQARLAAVFERARDEARSAFIGYLPAGYPDIPRSVEAFTALADAGCDLVEVGLPYSDPLMDGPVIQDAVQASLAAGTRTADVLHVVEALAGRGTTAVVMTYWNPVERYGVEAFARDLASAGGSGVITPDLIPDEAQPWISAARAHELASVFLVAPSSVEDRLAATARACRGFVYAASTMGVTGARSQVGGQARRLVERVRAVTDLPIGVGLGVSTPDQAAQVAEFADGVIVGSALVARLLQEGPWLERVEAARSLASSLAAGMAAHAR